MKRLSLSALALLALFGLLLTGCPSPSNTPDPEPEPTPTTVTLATGTALVPGTVYAGSVTVTMGALSEWNVSSGSDVYFNVDVSNDAVTEGDVYTFTYTVSDVAGNTFNKIGVQSAFDNWGWNGVAADQWVNDGIVAGTEIICEETATVTTFDNNLAGFKFAIQSNDADIVGEEVTITFSSLVVTKTATE